MLKAMHEILVNLANFLVDTIGQMGYLGIVILMAIESSLIPLPSEIVMPPAGIHIANGNMEWIPVIAAGTFGSWIGATVNYLFSFFVGRPFLERYGKFFFLPPDKLHKVDVFFRKHGEVATFIGRLVVGVRHIISIPAGLTKMNYWLFSFYTCVGAAIWVSILTYAGYVMGKNQEMIKVFMKHASWYVLGFVLLVIIGHIVKQRFFPPKIEEEEVQSETESSKNKSCNKTPTCLNSME